MNRNIIDIIATLFATILFVCLVSAQQQPQTLLQPISSASDAKLNETCHELTTKPNVETNKYVFQAANSSKPCIVAQFSVYISTKPGYYIELKNGTVNSNKSACLDSALEKLVLDFECAQLEFGIKHVNESIYVENIAGFYNLPTQKLISNSTSQFNTTQGHYYKCNSEQIVGLGSNQSLVVKNMAYEAFRDASSSDFYRVLDQCALDSQVSDWVRIGVGVCLIALVAIVLIAYFVGRRRWSERSSYESV